MARHIRAQISLGLILVTVHASAPLAAPASATYTYDDLGRLRTGQFSGGRKIDYQYDAAGNRTTMTSGLVPTVTIGNAASSVTEGSSLSFPVTRTGATTQNVTVSCVPQDGSASATGAAPYADYATTAQTVTFLSTDPTPSTKTCLIQTLTDSYYEGTQTLSVILQNASPGIVIATPSTGTGSIVDANSAPTFTIGNGSAAEGAAIGLTITRNGYAEGSQSISYATADSSATAADGDYTPVGWTALDLTNLASSQSAGISIATTTDSKYENNEAFLVQLGSPLGGGTVGSPGTGTATISNNDAAPIVSINSPALAVNEGSVLTFTVSNSGNTNTAVSHSISWAAANGTATAGVDYTAASGTVSFANGETSKTIQVTTLTDGVYEGANETVLVNLSTNGSSNGATIGTSQGTGTVADLDNPIPSVPTSLRQSPISNSGTYQILWNASTGAVSYYVLEQNQDANSWGSVGSISAPTTFKQFSSMPSATYEYRVKACSASNQCSTYSNVVTRTVCNPVCD